MDYNIINEYFNLLFKSYDQFFKIILKHKYQKELVHPFIVAYLDLRYFNETSFHKEKNMINRVNKELLSKYKEIVTDNNKEVLKNIISLFAYIIYIDDTYPIENEGKLITSLIEDENIKIKNKEELKNSLTEWYSKLIDKKGKFNKPITSKEFHLVDKRVENNLFYVKLEHNVKISYLYSEVAIDKAYTTGTVDEDKQFVAYIMLSHLILDNAINLNFNRRYLVDFPSTLYSKEKKCKRLLNIINNPLAKKYVYIKIYYEDYLKNKEKINKLLKEGYLFSLIIDDTYEGKLSDLILFSYIFVYEDNKYFDMIEKESSKKYYKVIKM